MHVNEGRLTTQLTLANAVELTAAVLSEVMGEEITNKLNGELLDGELLRDTIAANVQSNFARYTGDVK